MKTPAKLETGKIIGRVHEQGVLSRLFKSKKAEFLAIYGRRRVGKTFLIKNYFSKIPCIFFNTTGIQKGSIEEQLEQFSKQVGITFYAGAFLGKRNRWWDAFEDLHKAMGQIPPNKKIVLFFDEFPWMVTKRSNLLKVLEYYWNHYWCHDPRIKLIICGSSASWIVDKIVNNKGGLYNRVTWTIRLYPFSLCETKSYLTSLGVKLNSRQILDLYMVLGGIPHYLSKVTPGVSAHQAIDALLFRKDGALVSEFERLFASLFQEGDAYINIVQIIAKHRYGINQAQLIKEAKLSEGGSALRKLKELEEAGFISSFLPYGHQEKGVYYKVIDEFTLFYLYWVQSRLGSIRHHTSSNYWVSKAQSPSWKSWSGYSFEAVCNKHLAQIRKALDIHPGADTGSWRFVSKSGTNKNGTQIDLLFDRPDNTITLCEIKHSDKPFLIDKSYAKELEEKIEIYQQQTRTPKQILIAMVTSNDLKESTYSRKMISNSTSLEDLFIF